MIQSHFNALGRRGIDQITGFKGVVTSVTFDLYGCIQVILTPVVKKDGTIPDGRWFDIQRIRLSDKAPVMEVPDFVTPSTVSEGRKGAAPKPSQHRQSLP